VGFLLTVYGPAKAGGFSATARGSASLGQVGDRWALLAVREVMFGNHRFSEIARNTAAPRDRLAARLKALVAAGILERRQYQSSPLRHDYHLTAAGRELLPVMHALRA
jgi:DNA-binding HxlR family transcriptional regulator